MDGWLTPPLLREHLAGKSCALSGAAEPLTATESVGTARVRVLRGHSLEAKDGGGKSDPYVVLTVGKQKLQTKTKKLTINPVWDETLELEVPSWMPISRARRR